ncbi:MULTISPECIES: hypothetical protein [Nonomuraea]|uniref:DUF3558 domain-containing protein n=1 Tax=Nonomuraea ferruginea TaxID=46174 RepID=A0ABT4T011_9ACTN|nr:MULTISPECIES: hypothetical protein [Nonomuraea]MDA0642832.1 hypothetical protein [Nonomuraea ferruginea]TXK33926.1 hypothetical protein FR742_31385 [Nonomuraea sp. C10]TXK38166.1 hypothetical protein FR742_00035 [Nonomuraea sp. C10]
MSTRTKALCATLLALTLSSGCTQGPPPPVPEPTVDTRAVSDIGPYWCDVIPQQAVRIISGLAIPLTEDNWGVPTTHGGCLLRNEYTRFSINWSIRGGNEALDLAQENFGRRRLADLPTDLGKGLIAYTEGEPRTGPYVAFILFRCGNKRPWMGIDFSEVAKGRNVITDLTTLLRIARDRFGEIHRCTPKAS